MKSKLKNLYKLIAIWNWHQERILIALVCWLTIKYLSTSSISLHKTSPKHQP